MNKCFGIVSWLPDQEPARQQRKDRINRIFAQLNKFWPDIDILIVAQNWKDFKPNTINNKIVKKSFDKGLGILQARKTLRAEFLKTNYDYIIMLDDDAIISAPKDSAKQYMQLVDQHPNGFCFIHKRDKTNVLHSDYHEYADAQLNLCAISKKILEQVDFPNIDPQKNQGYEDCIFAAILHTLHHDAEFLPPVEIYCTQFQNKNEVAPSTWAGKTSIKQDEIWSRTHKFMDFLVKYKYLPNMYIFEKYGLLVQPGSNENTPVVKKMIERLEEEKNPKRLQDGRLRGAYLYW